MVRLKVRIMITQMPTLKFQFLYGSIKSRNGIRDDGISTLFQFLYGSIKSQFFPSTSLLFWNFNSSMVRLKVKALQYLGALTAFQFLYGSIKSPHPWLSFRLPFAFQFLYGSIKSQCASHGPC